jgi:hypothetical protein
MLADGPVYHFRFYEEFVEVRENRPHERVQLFVGRFGGHEGNLPPQVSGGQRLQLFVEHDKLLLRALDHGLQVGR